MSAAIKVLVIGGYGVFGSRLVQLLEDEQRLSLLVAGRSVDPRPPPSFAHEAIQRRNSHPLLSIGMAMLRVIWQRSGPISLSTSADRFRPTANTAIVSCKRA